MPSLKSTCLTAAAAVLPFTAAFLDEATYPFQLPTETDVRSPCPGLNALANHGLLPRDGKNIDLPTLIAGAYKGFSLASEATTLVGGVGLQASTTGNASTFNLDDLAQHLPRVIEHDGSMTRNDSYWGDCLTFSDQAYARTLATWGDNQTITFEVAAAERKARFAYGAATNPQFNGTFANTGSLLEYGLVLGALGDPVLGNPNITLVKYLFENERLPLELGWQPPTTNLTAALVQGLVLKIAAHLV